MTTKALLSILLLVGGAALFCLLDSIWKRRSGALNGHALALTAIFWPVVWHVVAVVFDGPKALFMLHITYPMAVLVSLTVAVLTSLIVQYWIGEQNDQE